jgi:hypothetical protein
MLREHRILWAWLVVGLLAFGIAVLPRQTTTNPDGWHDAGVHVVDDFWVTVERPCASIGSACEWKLEAAAAVLHHEGVLERPIAAWSAEVPTMRDARGVTMFAALTKPTFLILDFADGRRRTFALMCGPESHTNHEIQMGCHPSDLPMFRVGNGSMADASPPI